MLVKKTLKPMGKQTFGDLQLRVAKYAEKFPERRFFFTKKEWSGRPDPEKAMLVGALKF